MSNRQTLFATLITPRIIFTAPTQLYCITKYVKWAPEYVLDLRLFIFNQFPENGTLVPQNLVVGT
jgi:hypothetical protein